MPTPASAWPTPCWPQASAGDEQFDAARASATRLLEVAPQWTIDGFVQTDFVRPERMRLIESGLREAGLPD
jgi:hypothetical protein